MRVSHAEGAVAGDVIELISGLGGLLSQPCALARNALLESGYRVTSCTFKSVVGWPALLLASVILLGSLLAGFAQQTVWHNELGQACQKFLWGELG